MRTTTNDNHNGDEDYNSDGISVKDNEFISQLGQREWVDIYVDNDEENCNHNENYLDDFDNYEEGERKRDDDEEEREDCEETGAHPGTLVTS